MAETAKHVFFVNRSLCREARVGHYLLVKFYRKLFLGIFWCWSPMRCASSFQTSIILPVVTEIKGQNL